MKVSLIIPTLNEAAVLPKTLALVPKKLFEEMIVVDGHSKDATLTVARKLGCRTFLQPRFGYGDAVSYGVKQAKGSAVIFMDADGSQDPKALPRFIAKLKEGHDLILGSRYLPGSGSEDDTLIRYLGNKIFTFLANSIHHLNLSDSLYLYAAFPKKSFKRIRPTSDNMEFCMEFIIRARKAGLDIVEIPVKEKKRLAGNSKVNAFYHGFRILLWTLKKYD